MVLKIHFTTNYPVNDERLCVPDEVKRFFEEEQCFQYDDDTSLGDFILYYYRNSQFSKYMDLTYMVDRFVSGVFHQSFFEFVYHNENRLIAFTTATKINDFIQYIGCDNEISIKWIVDIGGKGGLLPEVGNKIGVVFWMWTNEGNHLGKPHIHVIDKSGKAKISVGLQPVEILEDNKDFHRNRKKDSLKYIKANSDYFLKMWEEKIHGIYSDPIEA